MRIAPRFLTGNSVLGMVLHWLFFAAICLATALSFAWFSTGKTQSLAEYISAICSKPFRSAPTAEEPFLAENVSAMTKMMIDMGIEPSGSIDRDFVAMMVPHHQGAIDMAQAELRYGHNQRLIRMAQEIIVTQQQEIAAMRLAVGEQLPPSLPAPDQVAPAGVQLEKSAGDPAEVTKEP